jgi:hypothetical protein
VLRKTAVGFEVLGEPDGIEQLGGIDFDEAVFRHVVANLDADGQFDPDDEAVTEALARLRRDCVAAKEALSFDTDVMVPVALPGRHTRVRLNRSEFEAMIEPTLQDTVTAMQRALRSARVAPEDLRTVLLAGGSSRIPLVGQMLSGELDRPVLLDPHPEHSVALGAALTTAPARVTATARIPVPVPVPVPEPEPPPIEPEPKPRRSFVAWLRQSPRRLGAAVTVLAVLAGTGLWFVLNASASESPRRPVAPSRVATPTPTPTPSPSPSPTTIVVPPPPANPPQQPPPVVKVLVPDVFGKTEDEARRILRQAGFTVSTMPKADSDHPKGTVIGINPAAGKLVNQGSRVTLTVATETPSPRVDTTPVSPPISHR